MSPTDNSATLTISSCCLLPVIINSVLIISSLRFSLFIHIHLPVALIQSSVDLMASDSFTSLLGLNDRVENRQPIHALQVNKVLLSQRTY